jgi:hypothetical protein
MGWNSYNCFGSAVHESEVRANADYMATHLKQAGWLYIVVDFLWSYDNPPESVVGNPFQSRLEDGSYIPWLAMDRWGRLLPQKDKFPSAAGDKGFRPLADYVHSLGLRFGIHVMRGIPRQAVWASDASDGSVAGHKAYYVALFNIGPRANEIAIDFAQLGIRGKVAVRNLWQRKDAGIFNRRYTQSIPPHGAALIRVVAK